MQQDFQIGLVLYPQTFDVLLFLYRFADDASSSCIHGWQDQLCKRRRQKRNHSLIQAFPERSSVHFVFDVDRGLTKDKKLNEKIIAYLSGQVFAKGIVPDIIWFNKNIECVLLGHSVSDNKKAETARNFYTQGHCELDEAHMEALHYEGFPKIDTSNILVVLYSQLPIGKKAKPLIKTNEKKKKI